MTAMSLQATSYLNKLPKSFTAEDRILVADPMLATGTSLASTASAVSSARLLMSVCCRCPTQSVLLSAALSVVLCMALSWVELLAGSARFVSWLFSD